MFVMLNILIGLHGHFIFLMVSLHGSYIVLKKIIYIHGKSLSQSTLQKSRTSEAMPTHKDIVKTYFKEKTHRSEKYKKFIRSQPCAICGLEVSQHHHEPLNGHGMALKGPDNEALPLCYRCHTERHIKGRDTFYKEHHKDWRRLVKHYQYLYGGKLCSK